MELHCGNWRTTQNEKTITQLTDCSNWLSAATSRLRSHGKKQLASRRRRRPPDQPRTAKNVKREANLQGKLQRLFSYSTTSTASSADVVCYRKIFVRLDRIFPQAPPVLLFAACQCRPSQRSHCHRQIKVLQGSHSLSTIYNLL